MKCGCVANATCNGKPICAIHAGLTPDAAIVSDTQPDLTGRKARCPDCKGTVNSSFDLAFFAYRPEREFDSFYCGCRGWN